ncbi:MAG: hypothetical protein E2O39_03350 [Planctomycetota bacterium]|nr:MAG: hypothetical protein E2O39_03350 [Planctomycetota bacterium]
MIPALLLPLFALAPFAQDDPQPARAPVQAPREARVEVHQGRAVGVRKGAPERTLRRGEPWITAGENHLEVSAGSEVAVLWPGRASLQVWGPASLQWGPVDSELATGPDDLSIRLFDVARVEFETRRGEHELLLPGGWRARLGEVAIHIRGLPGGPVELRHHAGRPIRLTWRGDVRDARPPITVYPGSNVRLDRPAEPPGTDRHNVQAWDAVEWPWRRGKVGSADALPMGTTVGAGAPERSYGRPTPWGTAGQAASVPARPSAPLSVTVTPGPTGARSGSAVSPAFEPASWRGLAAERLAVLGPLVVQRAPGAEVRKLASGRWMVALDAMAPAPIWVFGARRDFLLQPGALAVFESDGGLGMRSGTVRGAEQPPGRPPHGALRR